MTPPIENLPGREIEAQALLEWLGSPAGGLLLIGGESGVGKSRLVELARQGAARVLTARCWPVTGAAGVREPYQVILELVRQFGSATMSRRAIQALSWLPGGHKYQAGSEAEAPSKLELTEGLLGIFDQAADEPTVLVLEDLHWADDSTLELLPVLLERLRHTPTRMIATFRDKDVGRGHPLRGARDAIRRGGQLHELNLGALKIEGSAALLEDLLAGPVAPTLLAYLHTHSAGLPLWLVEMARSLQRGNFLVNGPAGWELAQAEGDLPIPESFRDAVLIRCESLPEEAQRLLDLAALLGVEMDLGVLLAAGEAAKLTEVRTALGVLLEADLLREIPRSGRAEFPHAMTREVVLETISWTTRRQCHGIIADVLTTMAAPLETLAEHLAEAWRHEAAVEAYLAVARRTCQIHAHREAYAYGKRALQLWPAGVREAERLDLLEMLACCGKLCGKLAEAARHLSEAAEHPLVIKDEARLGQIYSELATVYQLQGANQPAMEARAKAAGALERAGQKLAAAWEYLGSASQYTDHIRLAQAMEAAKRAVELARETNELELWSRSLSQLGMIEAMQGAVDRGKETVRQALNLALQHGLTTAAAEAYRRLALVHDYASEYQAQTDIFRAALDYCAVNDVHGESALCISCMAYACTRTGEWKQALDICRQVLATPNLHEVHYALAKAVTGVIQVFRGEIRPGRQNVLESNAILHRAGQVPTEFFAAMAFGLIAEEEGKEAEARAHYLRLTLIWRDTEDRHDVLMGLCAAARFFGDAGDAETLAALAELADRVNSSVTNSEALAGLATVLGELALANREAAQAVVHYRQVTAIFEQLKLPFDLALAEHRLGLALIAAGDRVAAVEALRKSHRIARNLGARPLAGRVAAALGSIGESVMEAGAESPERAVWAGLTQRQREVAVLIAEGCTNKEIAQKLYLSPRTIDMHVGHILGRLDCRTRSEAIRKLADLGVLGG